MASGSITTWWKTPAGKTRTTGPANRVAVSARRIRSVVQRPRTRRDDDRLVVVGVGVHAQRPIAAVPLRVGHAQDRDAVETGVETEDRLIAAGRRAA